MSGRGSTIATYTDLTSAVQFPSTTQTGVTFSATTAVNAGSSSGGKQGAAGSRADTGVKFSVQFSTTGDTDACVWLRGSGTYEATWKWWEYGQPIQGYAVEVSVTGRVGLRHKSGASTNSILGTDIAEGTYNFVSTKHWVYFRVEGVTLDVWVWTGAEPDFDSVPPTLTATNTQIASGVMSMTTASTNAVTTTFADGFELDDTVSAVFLDSYHAHSADNVVLAQFNSLTVADGLHTLLLDGPTSEPTLLGVQDATHGHAADSSTVVHGSVSDPTTPHENPVIPQEAAHSWTTDSPALTQAHTLVVADTLHAHSAANGFVGTGLYFFSPPARPTVAPMVGGLSGLQRRLARHQSAGMRAQNVYVLNDGSVREREPDSWDDVARVFFGGHQPELVTDEERILLEEAGYEIVYN